MNSILFYVPGLPKGQPRARAVAFAGRARVYDPGTANAWKACIIEACQKAMFDAMMQAPLLGPIELRIDLYFPRPKSHYLRGKLRSGLPIHVTKKPDADNVCKAAQDALTAAGIWADDAQIARLYVSKSYGTEPFSAISIKEIVE